MPARLVRLSRPGPSQGYETRKDNDETTVLTAIYFAGRKYEMEIGQEPAATDVKHNRKSKVGQRAFRFKSGGACLRAVTISIQH